MHSDDDLIRMLRFQYKAVFQCEISEELIKQPRAADIAISYGKMGYDQEAALLNSLYHVRIQSYNKLMTDDVIFSLFKR